ncbi:MAG: hypothetical protein M3483_04625 [Gemmatimonadota bacterium]|nr:hypothetical protein [Gemmatimonadota bacterium]
MKIPTSLPRLLAESGLIVLSILLALAVTEWNEGRNRAARADLALENIDGELTANMRALERVLPYHRESLRRLDVLLADSSRRSPQAENVFAVVAQVAPEGLKPPTLSSTAWDLARTTNSVGHLDFETLYPLSQVYDVQRTGVESTIPRLTGIVLSRESFDSTADPMPTLHMLQIMFNELTAQEAYLVEIYREMLQRR